MTRKTLSLSRLHTRRTLVGAACALVLSAMLPAAQGQDAAKYPSQAIRMIVPYPAGGATDTLARMMTSKRQDSRGQNVIVENKPGASGTIGNDLVAQSPPDGYSVLMGITAIVQVPALMPNLPYDVMKDLQPLAQVASTNSILIVPKNAKVIREANIRLE